MSDQLNRRLAFLGILIVGLFAALFTRAWYLQVLTTEELADKALLNHVEVVITQPTRGRILDRHGVVLADNVRNGVVTVDQSRYAPGQKESVLGKLSDLLDIPVSTFEARLQDLQSHPLAAKVVATGLDEYGMLRVSEASLPGVEAKWVMSRVYPQREIGSHVIGYVGAMSESQTSRLLEKGYLVTVLDNFMYRQNSLLDVCYHPNLEIIVGDVRNEEFFKKILNKHFSLMSELGKRVTQGLLSLIHI